jgi:hypothetical protein
MFYIVIKIEGSGGNQKKAYLKPAGTFSLNFSEATQFSRQSTAMRICNLYHGAKVGWCDKRARSEKAYKGKIFIK